MIVRIVDVCEVVDHHCLNFYSYLFDYTMPVADCTIYKVDVNYLSHYMSVSSCLSLIC